MRPTTELDEAPVRRYQYDEESVVVADIGVPDAAVTVDVVDETAIVVVEDGGGSVEREIELPPGATTATVNNGVVTVEGQA